MFMIMNHMLLQMLLLRLGSIYLFFYLLFDFFLLDCILDTQVALPAIPFIQKDTVPLKYLTFLPIILAELWYAPLVSYSAASTNCPNRSPSNRT